MCGIAGYWGTNPPSDRAIDQTLELMKRRGPDHQACESISAGTMQGRLLHSRLSIIDLDPRSNQPFTIGGTTVVYNGEIYNYVELRRELEKKGVEFQTQSDTEVLLQCYRIHGPDCVRFFEGMWAFAIWDAETRSLFLSRDRFAEKPLYYIETADGFYFGSEIKFLKALVERSLKVNQRHLLRQLVHGYKALYKTRETYFEEVQELRFAESILIGPDGASKRDRYWNRSPAGCFDGTGRRDCRGAAALI